MKKLLLLILSISFVITNAQIPQLLKDINPSTGPTSSGVYTPFKVLNNKLFFIGNYGQLINSYGTELVMSDGTSGGTVVFKDINGNGSNGSPTSFTGPHSGLLPYYYNGNYYYIGNNGVNGIELYKSDLTATGTNMLLDLAPGNLNSILTPLFELNNLLFCKGSLGSTTQYKFYTTDGTASNTFTFEPQLFLGNGDNEYFKFNNKIIFSASVNSPTAIANLFSTDGTSGGTFMLNSVSLAHDFTMLDPLHFMFASGANLWISDGTAIGTNTININSSNSTGIGSLSNINGKIFFFSKGSGNNLEFWTTDGTSVGTNKIKIFTPSTTISSGDGVIRSVLNNKLIFAADSGNLLGNELWAYDFVTNKVNLLYDTEPLSNANGIDYLTTFKTIGNKVYFNPRNTTYGREVWATDGTVAGTQRLFDLNAGVADGCLGGTSFEILGNKVFFIGNNGLTGHEMYYFNDLAISIDENSKQQINFSVYPNPVKELLNIKLETLNNEPTEIKISNLLGEIVLAETAASNNFTLNTNNLNSGVYFVTLTNKGIQTTQKIIIQ